ncbi:MAG: adenosylmethionine decarboxylase [Candidatus Diapherotrites archaeon]|nr:adenosylmethionine decarboxylase [Candidatus Diapherotrites archaeon]
MKKQVNGFHIIAELHGCPTAKLERAETVKKILLSAAKYANFVVVGNTFHQFKPRGATGIVLLASSHISAHTWPEHNYVALDVYSCDGREKAKKATEFCIKAFKAKKFEVREIKRFR